MSSNSSNEPSWTVEETTPLMEARAIVSLHNSEAPLLATDTSVHTISLGPNDTPDTSDTLSTKWHGKNPQTKAQHFKVVRHPRKNSILYAFYWLEGIAILGAVCLLATQILPLFYLSVNDIGIIPICLRIYIGLFCILFLFVECETPIPFLQSSQLLQTYFTRGFLYSFLGLIGMEEAYSVRINDMQEHKGEEYHVAWASLFMQVSSWLVVAVGMVYMMCGMCCLRAMRDKMKQLYLEKVEAYHNLDSLEHISA